MMLAVLIPLRELYYGNREIGESSFETAFFNEIFFSESIRSYLKYPDVKLFLLTEHGHAQSSPQKRFTLFSEFGVKVEVSITLEIFKKIQFQIRNLTNHELFIELSDDIELGTYQFKPLEKCWDIPGVIQFKLFHRWTPPVNLDIQYSLSIETYQQVSSIVAEIDLSNALRKINHKNFPHNDPRFTDKHALIVVDTDNTLFSNEDSQLFDETILNKELIKIIKFFENYLQDLGAKTRSILMTARDKVAETATWDKKNLEPFSLQNIIRAANGCGLHLELENNLSFSNAPDAHGVLKQLKVEHIRNKLRSRELVLPRGSLIILFDDSPAEVLSERAIQAEDVFLDHEITLCLIPVSRHRYVDSLSNKCSLFSRSVKCPVKEGVESSNYMLSKSL